MKFAGKSKAPLKIDFNPLQVGEARYVEPVEINMVKITEDFNMEAEKEVVESSENQMKYVYPRTEEDLVNFLRCFQAKESEVLLCPRSSTILDKKYAKEIENS